LQGKQITLTIERATIEKVYANGAPVTTPCLWFKGTRKGLLLNTGNRRTLARLFGDDASAVCGKQIVIAPAQSEKDASALTVKIVGAGQAATITSAA
jgi:hypothetical protein